MMSTFGYPLPIPPKYGLTFVNFFVPSLLVMFAIICACLVIDLDFLASHGSKMS